MDNKKVKRLVVILAVFWTLFGAFLYNLEMLGIFADRDLFECLSLLFIAMLVSLSIKSKLKYIWLVALVFNCTDRIFPFVSHYHYYILFGIVISLVCLIPYLIKRLKKEAYN